MDQRRNVGNSPHNTKSGPRRRNTAWMMKDAGKLVHTVSANELHPDSAIVSSKIACETLSSFNWSLDANGISAPGGPPRWDPRPLPYTLSKEAPLSSEDARAAKLPAYPYEPAFRALEGMNPTKKFDDIHVFARRNSLRKLLDFVAGKAQEPFRMDLHMVNQTLFISRKEASAAAMIHGSYNSGYGKSFEAAFTKPQIGLEQSHSHHRLIRYPLGSLNCAVQFEVDAYYDDDQKSSSPVQPQNPVDDVVISMANLSTDPSRGSTTEAEAAKVPHGGDVIDPSKLAELKLHGKNRRNPLAQMWFSRTPCLIEGKHVEGQVQSIRYTNVEAQFGVWEAEHQQDLRKLVHLLHLLKSTVSETEGRKAILLCKEKRAPLTIFSARNIGDVLPRDVIDRHWGVDENSIRV